MEMCKEFLELARRLNQEKLFVASEKRHLQALHEKLQHTVEKLFHVAWIARQQRINLEGLVLSRPESTPSACCQRADALEGATFVDGYRHLGFRETQYGEFVQALRENTSLVAACLAAGERLDLAAMHRMVHVVLDSVYGHGILQEDEQLILQVLKCLLETQLAGADDPRRLLRHGTCAFGRVYKVFNEGLHSAKLFLTGALHEPILQLLMEDELFLDIDPCKAAVRFPPRERLRRFGAEGTAQYAASLQRYRAWTVRKLVQLTERFVAGIRHNLYCFPASLLWLVRQLYRVVTRARHVEAREAGAMCADLIFAFFVCPAIVNPEPYGICDAPIGYVARFNLMQVAQILQVLAMAKWEAPDPKLADLYGQFDHDCMSAVLDYMLEGEVDEALPATSDRPVHELVRTAILVTEGDLQALIRFLQKVHEGADEAWVDKKALQQVLSTLPPTVSAGRGCSSDSLSPLSSPAVHPVTPATPSSKRSTLLGKVGGKSRGGHSVTHHGTPPSSSGDAGDHLHHNHFGHGSSHRSTEGGGDAQLDEVLVISLNVSVECPGMLSEHKVLSLDLQQQKLGSGKARAKQEQQRRLGEAAVAAAGEMMQQEKRTRFSLSHEQEDSIGNTSDNLEAVSEAASNHSVSSSIELENENDNLSDMISANVSGRGTPNVSGRDTPLSQVEGEERDRRPLDLPVTAQKQNREDISDKFGKFEIRTLLEGDETISLVSDTWSTDVLASDSETVEQSERPLLEDVGQALRGGARLPDAASGVVPPAVPPPASETASEAWSTDALASDSERLQDVDTDDTASLTRSDDASVARSDDAVAGRPADASLEALLLRLDVTDESTTPQASSSHSPVDDFRGGPTAPNRVWLSTLHAAAGFRPIPAEAQPHSGGAQSGFSMPVIAVPKVLRHPVSEMVHDFNDFEIRMKDNRIKGPRFSESFKYTHGKVASILSSFDPLMEGKSSSEEQLNSENGMTIGEGGLPPSDDTQISDVHGMQSLGRLSLSMDGLPERVILPSVTCSTLQLTSATISDAAAPSDGDGGIEQRALRTLLPLCDFNSAALPAETENRPNDGNPFASDDVNAFSPSLSPPSPARSGGVPLIPYPVANSSPLACNGGPGGFFFALPSASTNGCVGQDVTLRTTCPGGDAGSSSGSSNCSVTGDARSLAGESVSFVAEQRNRHVQHRRREQQQQSMDSPAPTASSGAIPKSISFDKSAEKGDKDSVDSDDKGKKSFFKSFKLTLKRPNRKGVRYHEEQRGNNDSNKEEHCDDGPIKLQFEENREETGDDILAKYRNKSSNVLSDARGDCEERPDYEDSGGNAKVGDENYPGHEGRLSSGPSGEGPGLDESYAFADAKRKLRLVLGTVDARAAPWLENTAATRMNGSSHKFGNELEAFLRVQLAEAVNLQDRSLTAQLHETLRCVRGFDKAGCKRLLKSLKEDYKSRYPYIAYLIRCRQGLLFALSHLERLLKRVERDKAVCNRFMISVCVRFFLEQQERGIQKFMEEFQKLTASDEKTVIVEQFLQFLYKQMELDPILQGASSSQIEQAHGVIERSIMSQVYILALYPNGDGDVHRDQVLHDHVQKLSQVITPNHKDLRVPKMYHYECPWSSAQAEIITINAYKTPRDKLQCVVRCCTTIMNLLSMSNQKSVPAADDFIPVLVYILVKANPPGLLSTIQYVNSFYQKQLNGEDEYWWTQFCSAVEFIKTMDYTE